MSSYSRTSQARRSLVLFAVAICLVVGVAACSSSPSSKPADQPVVSNGPSSASPVTAQFNRGTAVFAQVCAQCHGPYGEGSSAAPALIGSGALPLNPPAGARMRNVQFKSAMELGMFIKNTMPPGGPATPPQDVAAVMAYMLSSNGVPPTQAISPSTAGSIPVRP